MNNMVVNAIFSLRDMLSGGLARIQKGLKVTDHATASLSARMGKLALAMAPVAVACGILLLVFAGATSKAIAFESAMADVGKVVNFETRDDFDAMGKAVLDMSSRIPMAADGLAAIIASAAQSGVAKQDLLEFAEQAAKMGVAFDLTGDVAGKMMADWRSGMNLSLPRVYALADAVNHLSNNMNAAAPALGEVMQRVGPLAMQCGLAETQIAALGAAFLSAGASPEIASTALSKFTATLVKGEAMTKKQADAFSQLGLSSVQMAKDMQTNAQGTIFNVLQALSKKPKELQISLLTEMFGEESIKAIAPLLANMDNLSQAFNLVGDASSYAGSMQGEFETRSATAQNALQLLTNRLNALYITIGNAFLPVVSACANILGDFADGLRAIFANPVGQWFLKVAGAIATGVVALTAFAAIIAGAGVIMPVLSKSLVVLNGAILGLGMPVLMAIGVVTALYIAYKNNFGGMADTVNRWANNIKLIFNGVKAVLSSLSGGVGQLKGELARDIEAAGLLGAVTKISKIVYRFKQFFTALWTSIQVNTKSAVDKLDAIFGRLINAVSKAVGMFFEIFGNMMNSLGIGNGIIASNASAWSNFGNVIGEVIGWIADVGVFCLEKLAIVIDFLSPVLGMAGFWVLAVWGAFKVWNAAMVIGRGLVVAYNVALKGFQAAMIAGKVATFAFVGAQKLLNLAFLASPIGWIILAITALAGLAYLIVSNWDSICAWWFGLWDGIASAVSGAWEWVKNSCMGVWNWIKELFGSINLADCGRAIIQTLVDGLVAAKDYLVGKVTGIFQSVRDLLPFSDAKEGPFSSLTKSGSALLNTLGDGVWAAKDAFVGKIKGIFQSVRDFLPFSDAKEGPFSQLTKSGSALMGTLEQGVAKGQGGFLSRIGGVFEQANGLMQQNPVQGFFNSLLSGFEPQGAELALVGGGSMPAFAVEHQQAIDGNRTGQNQKDRGVKINSLTVTLPNVKDAKTFADDLKKFVEDFDV